MDRLFRGGLPGKEELVGLHGDSLSTVISTTHYELSREEGTRETVDSGVRWKW